MNAAATPMLVVAKKDLPVKDFREFVAYLKANAAKMNYGTGGVGATSHLTCLFLDSLLGVQPQHVPFRGSGPALNALLAGQIDYVCDQTVAVVPQVQAEEVKGLVVAVKNRLPVIPDVPTSAEQGLPDFQATGWNAMFAPKATPKPIVDKLNARGAGRRLERRQRPQAPPRSRGRAPGRGGAEPGGPGRAGPDGDRQVGAGDQEGGRHRAVTGRAPSPGGKGMG